MYSPDSGRSLIEVFQTGGIQPALDGGKPVTVTSPTPSQSPYLSILRNPSQDQPVARATIACVIPAYNEEETIAEVLTALLNQTRLPDVIHVVINNSDDETFFVARDFAGPHQRTYRDDTQVTEVFIHDIGVNKDKKVGALNYGFAQVCDDFDYFLGVDGDTVVDPYAVEQLEKEILSDPRIGGISAIYTVAEQERRGLTAKFLTAGQRTEHGRTGRPVLAAVHGGAQERDDR